MLPRDSKRMCPIALTPKSGVLLSDNDGSDGGSAADLGGGTK